MYQQSWSRNQPFIRGIAAQRRREHIWAWLTALLLVLCWDATLRLDHKVPMPRPRLSHAVELETEGRGRMEMGER